MKSNSILGGALLLTGANFLLRLISIAFNVFLAGRIGADGLGLLQLISTVGVFAGMVGSSGVRVAAMCLCAEEFGKRCLGGVRKAVNVCLRYGLLISTLAALALFFSADTVAGSLLGDVRAGLSLRVMGLLLPFVCLSGIMAGYYTACGRIRQLVAIQLVERLVSLLLTALLLLFWAKDDLSRSCCAIVLGSSLGAACDFLFLAAMFRRDLGKVKPEGGTESMNGRLLRLCVPIALNDYLRAGLNTAEQLLIPFGLAKYAGSATEAMAGYGTIHAMVFPILMFPAAILYSVSDLLVPELSRSRAMRRNMRICDLSGKCLRVTMLFSCAVAGFFFCCAEPLGLLVYDSAAAGAYLKLFAPMVIMLYLDAITDGMLKGMAEQVSCVRYNTLTSLLDVAFLFVLLPRWGISGYVFSFAVTHAVNLVLSVRRLLKVTGHRLSLPRLSMPLWCLLPALLLALLLPENASAWSTLWQRGGVFFLLYFPLCLLSGALGADDRLWLRSVFRREKQRKSTHRKTSDPGRAFKNHFERVN